MAPGDKDATTIYRRAIHVTYAVGFDIENVRVENAAEYACTLDFFIPMQD